MSDDIAELQSITLTNAPASISVDVYRGLEGNRGAYIIPGLGNPSTYFDISTKSYMFPDPTGAEEKIVAQLYDWYLDLSPVSPTYMSTFQLKKNGTWEQIFKVIPNVYNTNRVISFTGGVATTNVVVSDETLLLEQKFGNNFNIANLSVNLDIDIENMYPGVPYPVMSSFTAGVPTYSGGLYTFPITIVASQLHPVNGIEAVSGSRLVHISISVI